MNKQDHTPGPWKAEHGHFGAASHDDELAGIGWSIEGPPEALNRGQFKRAADAHLIAAAPDLLKALEFVSGYFFAAEKEGNIDEAIPYDEISQAADWIRAALAKARPHD